MLFPVEQMPNCIVWWRKRAELKTKAAERADTCAGSRQACAAGETISAAVPIEKPSPASFMEYINKLLLAGVS